MQVCTVHCTMHMHSAHLMHVHRYHREWTSLNSSEDCFDENNELSLSNLTLGNVSTDKYLNWL